MSSFYDDASLVVIPSGYKTSKIYAEKPTDGSGDLTFTRASDATRVGPDGLIEKVRTNLLTYSQDFSNAIWNKNNFTLTAGQTDPNGGTTATNIDPTNTASAYIRQSISITSGVKYTWSIYIKGSTTGQSIALYTDGASNIYEIKNLTTSWQRFTGVATAASTGSSGFYVLSGSGYPGLTDLPFDIAFAQVEASDIATDYIPTTSAAVSVGPVSNVPRLDYLGSSCPRLLLEPQRTNLALYSEQFDNAYWSKLGTTTPTITANAATSPDGTANADLLTGTGGVGQRIQRSVSVATSTAYSVSVYVKTNTATTAQLNVYDGSTDRGGTITFSTGAITTYGTGVTAASISMGNNWYRFVINYTSFATTSVNLQYGISDSTSYYIWGAQFEAGSYATSYIPTLGASVTRVADAASKTSISSLIGQTEGTLFFDLPAQNFRVSDYQTLFLIYNNAGLANKYFHFYKTINGLQLTFEVFNGTSQCSLGYTMAQNTRYKVAAVYKNNRFELWVNGTLVSSDTSGTIATNTYDTIEFSYDSFNTNSQLLCGQAIVFKTALTATQLAELTTL